MKRTRSDKKLLGVCAAGIVGSLSPLLVVALLMLLAACGTRDDGPGQDDEPGIEKYGALDEVAFDPCHDEEDCCRHRWDCPGGYVCANSAGKPPGWPEVEWTEACGDESVCSMPGSCFAIDQVFPADGGTADAAVCGCNGVIYGDYRQAIEAGMMAFSSSMICEEMQEDMVACSSSTDCDDDEWCERGWCQPRPETCPDDLWPVCGGDGSTYETYDNPCKAALAEARVSYRGECR